MDQGTNELHEDIAAHGEEMRQELTDRARELRATVENYTRAKPLQAVGIAFGVGYLLSGALVSRTTARLAQLGLRFAFGGALKQAIATVGPELIMQAMAPRQRSHEGEDETRSSSSHTTTRQ